jgi:tetrahydromethanopterin S-methyltransferase subunit G
MLKITNYKQNCCKNSKENGLKKGILYGLLPHSVCIGFILASVLGSTLFMGFFKKLLILPYFFQLLIGLSLVFATISALIYLKNCGQLNPTGIKSRGRYLGVLYGTTLIINLFFFFVVFPIVSNISLTKAVPTQLALKVNIPCPGHAPLITDELKKVKGVDSVRFQFPDVFEIGFEKDAVSREQILNLDIFKSFKAKVI